MSRIITVDAGAFARLGEQLAAAGIAIGKVQSRAINTVAARTVTRARREIVAQVNLTASYVADRLILEKATTSRPAAIIKARTRWTTLATYGARQLTKAAKGSKGDPRRAIPAGRKAGGIAVTVHAGSRKTMPGAFFLPLRAGKEAGGNGMGVFIRTGAGRIEHKYGPSVNQVFRDVVSDILPDVQAALATEMTRYARVELAKALAK